jgi:hypothetical protein
MIPFLEARSSQEITWRPWGVASAGLAFASSPNRFKLERMRFFIDWFNSRLRWLDRACFAAEDTFFGIS